MAEKAENAQSDDAKARMLAALERKKQGTGAGPGAAGSTSGGGATHGKVGGKREFRRKSS